MKSFHLFSSARMRGFCNIVYSLLSKGIEKGYSQYSILIYVYKEEHAPLCNERSATDVCFSIKMVRMCTSRWHLSI